MDVGGEEDTVDVGGVGLEGGDGDEGGGVGFGEHAPDVDVALEKISEQTEQKGIREGNAGKGRLTLSLPAQRSDPSVATETLATETSSSGISWWVHLLAPRSQTRTLPPRSQLMSSPWLG